MSRTDGKGRRLESDYEENVKYLRKPQRSHSVSPELHSRIKSVITTTKDAGAVDEEQFRLGFEDVKQMSFSSGYELEKSLMSIHAILSNTNEDWEKRVDQVPDLPHTVCIFTQFYTLCCMVLFEASIALKNRFVTFCLND
jgi:hypothetical protein